MAKGTGCHFWDCEKLVTSVFLVFSLCSFESSWIYYSPEAKCHVVRHSVQRLIWQEFHGQLQQIALEKLRAWSNKLQGTESSNNHANELGSRSLPMESWNHCNSGQHLDSSLVRDPEPQSSAKQYLYLDFWPTEMWENKCSCFRPPSFGIIC